MERQGHGRGQVTVLASLAKESLETANCVRSEKGLCYVDAKEGWLVGSFCTGLNNVHTWDVY